MSGFDDKKFQEFFKNSYFGTCQDNNHQGNSMDTQAIHNKLYCCFDCYLRIKDKLRKKLLNGDK